MLIQIASTTQRAPHAEPPSITALSHGALQLCATYPTFSTQLLLHRNSIRNTPKTGAEIPSQVSDPFTTRCRPTFPPKQCGSVALIPPRTPVARPPYPTLSGEANVTLLTRDPR